MPDNKYDFSDFQEPVKSDTASKYDFSDFEEPVKKKEPSTSTSTLSPFGEELRKGLSTRATSESTISTQPKKTAAMAESMPEINAKTEKAKQNITERRLKAKGITFKENDANYQKEKKIVEKDLNEGNLILTTNRKGQPDFTRGMGFWESTANSFKDSFTSEKDAAKVNTIFNSKDLADYLDDLEKKQPDVKDKAKGFLGYIGEQIGGLPKMAGTAALGELVNPAVGGAIALGIDGEWLGMAAKRQELYYNKRDELINKGINPKEAREQAARSAIINAPIDALPEAAVNYFLGKVEGKSAPELSTSRKIFKDFVVKPMTVGAIGASKPLAEYGLEKAQGYDVKFNDALKQSGEGFTDYALMDLGFHVLMHPKELSKTAVSAAKEYLSNVEPEVLQSIAKKYGQNSSEILSTLDSYKRAKGKIAEYTPQDVMHNVVGLQEAIDAKTLKLEQLQKDKTIPESIIKTQEEEINKLKETQNKVLQTGLGDDNEVDHVTGDKVEKSTDIPSKYELTPTIVVEGEEYTGDNHGEAMDKAISDGKNIPNKDTEEGKQWRTENGMFKDRSGDLFNREQTEKIYGIRNSEELLPKEQPSEEKPTEVQQPTEVEKPITEKVDETKPTTEETKGEGEIKSNWNYEGEGDAFASNPKSREGKSAYVIRVLDSMGHGKSYNRAEQRGELDTESPLKYVGDKETVSAIDGNGNKVGVVKLQSDGGIEHLAVAPEFTKKGVATELIKQIKQNGADVNFEKSKKISPDAAKLFNKLNEQPKETIPNKETVESKTSKKIEQLRAEEQAEYDDMPNPKDKVKRKEIYDKYDKLITPLLESKKIEEEKTPTIKETKEVQNRNETSIKIDDIGEGEVIEKVSGRTSGEKVEKAEKIEDKNISSKARNLAKQLRSGDKNILPDWLKADLPKGTEIQGIDINEAFANALDTFADVYDKAKDFAKAVEEAAKNITDWYKENNIKFNEDDIKSKLSEEFKKQIPESKTPPPITPTEVKQEFEEAGDNWSAITKARLSELEAAKKLFEEESGTTWGAIHQEAMEKLASDYPNKTLYDAARDEVYKQAGLYDNNVDYNPTAKDLAVMQYLQAETENRINNLDISTEDVSDRAMLMVKHGELLDDMLAIAKAAQPREAGTAFGLRNREVKLGFNTDAGLKSRRIELIKAKGGEPLTEQENKLTSELWEQEKDIIQKENELKQKSMQEAFDNEIKRLEKEYQEKLKKEGKKPLKQQEKTEKLLSQKGKEWADKIRAGKITGLKSDPIGFSAAFNAALDVIAAAVEKGATIGEAISKYIEDNYKNKANEGIKFKKDIEEFIDRIGKKDESINKIKDFSDISGDKTVTNEMVSKGLVKDFVESFIGEVPAKDLLSKATEELKKVLPDVTEDNLREAYIKRGEFKQKTKSELISENNKEKLKLQKLSKLESDISSLKNKQQILSDKGDTKSALGVDAEIKAKEAELKAEMNRQGVKYSRQDKYAKASNETRASLHNERIDNLSKYIQDRIDKGDLSDIEKESLIKLKENLDNSKISLNPESKLDQSKIFDDAINKIEKSKNVFERANKKLSTKLSEVRNEINKIKDLFESDKNKAEQEAKLARQKDRLKSKNLELERKINAGEFEDKKTPPLTESDKELIKLQIEKNKLQSKFNAERQKLENENKSGWQKLAEFSRATYVAALIYKVGTFAKVGFAAIVRPTIENITKLITNPLFNAVFSDISIAAKRGGESGSITSIARSYEAQFAQYGEKAWAKKVKNNQDKFEKSNTEYYDYLKEHNKIVENNPKNSDIVKQSEKKLKKLENKNNENLLSTYIDMAYEFIGTSSIKDAIDALIYRSNRVERMFGYFDKESIKDGGYVDKFNYILGFIGRSHGALKTFSGRASFIASFTARLEAAIRDGVDVNDKFLTLADESYLDWEKGKYQQSNEITDYTNKVILSIENMGKNGKIAATLLRLDLPITRVPVNILHEAVVEYTAGLFVALWKIAKQYKKSNKELKMLEDAGNHFSSEEFKAQLKDKVQQMDAKTAATIARCFRKGAFGLGLYALVGSLGILQFGGFWQKGDKKKKEEDLKEGELNPSDIIIGGKKMPETAAKVLEHLPATYPTLLGYNAAKRYTDKIVSGKSTVDAALSSFVSDVEVMQNAIPQTKLLPPTTIIGGVATQLGKAVGNISSDTRDFFGYEDKDEEGNPIERKPLDYKDQIDLIIGDRKNVMSLQDYKQASSVLRQYKAMINKAKSEGATEEDIKDLMDERDEKVNEIREKSKEQ
jgi:hypothetical protein